MKNLSLISLLLMVGMILFLGGCRKDIENNDSVNFSESFFLKKYALKYLPFQSVELRNANDVAIDSLITKVHSIFVNNGIDNRRLDIETKYGYPLWTATEFIDFGGYKQTITALIHPVSQNITNFIHTDSRNQEISILYYKMTEEVDFVFLQRYFIGKILGVNNGVSLRGNGDGAGVTNPNPSSSGFWDCVTIVDLTTGTSGVHIDEAHTNQGWDITLTPSSLDIIYHYPGGATYAFYTINSSVEECEWVSNNVPYNGPASGGGSGSGGGGSDYNNQTNTWFKCKNYLKEKYNKEVNPEDDQYLAELYQNCGGCAKVLSISKGKIEKLKSANTSQKVKCAICKLNTYGFSGLTYFDLWDYISFPCENVDKDALLEELLPDCMSNSSISWSQFKEAVGNKTWINKIPIMTDMSASGSSDLKNLELVLGISKIQQTKLSDSDLCNAIKLAACLKPSAIGELSDGNEAEKAALLDFYKYTDLTNPCTGDAIDKDQIFLDLCANGNMSMSGLEGALEGVDYIKVDPSFENCKVMKCIYNKLYNTGSTMFCNNIYRFNYSDKIDLTIKVGTTDWNAEGTVTMSNNGTGVIMTFAKFNCNKTDHLQLAETILHESVHAKFRFDHANNGTTEAQFKANFLKYVNEKYGIAYSEHQLMIENYMTQLANELWELNGKKYDPSYYMAYVWDGLSSTWPDKFSDSKVKSWEDKRDIVKSNNPFKC